MKLEFTTPLRRVRETTPLVLCITNFVTVNDCANIILAAGGTPSMAEDIREVAECAAAANALVCNLGTTDKVPSMQVAGKSANETGRPVVLDPVAAGATSLRRWESSELLKSVHFAAIRGNASEIRALAEGGVGGHGVDVDAQDIISQDTLGRTVDIARQLAQKVHSVVAVSGPLDVVTDGTQTVILKNGCPTMARITGSGCMLTAMTGAFCGAVPEDPFSAVCSAVAVMGVAGDIAEEQRLAKGTGNATFRTDLIDAVFNLTETELEKRVRYELYEG